MNDFSEEEEQEEIEKVFKMIHSMKIQMTDFSPTIVSILEKEYLIMSEHILKFIQNIIKGKKLKNKKIYAK